MRKMMADFFPLGQSTADERGSYFFSRKARESENLYKLLRSMKKRSAPVAVSTPAAEESGDDFQVM